jgi:hypothetical protein
MSGNKSFCFFLQQEARLFFCKKEPEKVYPKALGLIARFRPAAIPPPIIAL